MLLLSFAMYRSVFIIPFPIDLFRKLLLGAGCVFMICFPFYTSAQTFTGTGGLIPDNGTVVDFPLNVSGLTPGMLDNSFGLVTVCMNITHTWDADLDVQLVSPGGMAILLFSGVGGSGDDFLNTCLDMSAPNPIGSAGAPFTGSFRPMGMLGNFNNGSNGNGVWKLRITDTYPADQGNLLDWSITFGANPPQPFPFTDSDLPLIVITTNGQTILNDPRIVCDMGIIDNGPGNRNALTDMYNNYNGRIAIEIRGSSSQSFPKKSYAFETQNLSGANLNVPLLGMPSENDWILYAPYTDKTMMRDALAYRLGRDLGAYAPRYAFAELFINGQYMGVYCLEEKIKRDNNRVNIATLTTADTSGNELTGGYILKIDRTDGPGSYFTSTYPGNFGNINFVYSDPEGHELHPLQKNYIENTIDHFEDVLAGPQFMHPQNGYRKLIHVPSFIDYFLVNELSNNVDGFRLSTFLYKNKNSIDSLIHMGPLWDYNLGFGNADYCSGASTSGWSYIHSGNCGDVPFWWDRFMQDSTFVRELRCRYEELRLTFFSTSYLNGFIDSVAQVLDESKDRNYLAWPILGTYVWPNPFVGNTYQQEIVYMKSWINSRLNWMDANIPGSCLNLGLADHSSALYFALFPNPANTQITFAFSSSIGITDLFIYDRLGKLLKQQQFSGSQLTLSVEDFSPGIYFVQWHSGSNQGVQKFVISR